MKSTRNLLLASFVVFWVFISDVAQACSPIKVVGIYFENNSSGVSAQQVLRMAQWIIDLKKRYHRYEMIYLDGTAEPGEASPKILGLERARNVKHVLVENFGFDAEKIHLPASGYVAAPVSENIKRYENGKGVRAVDIGLLPGCPHECSCQTGAFVEMP